MRAYRGKMRPLRLERGFTLIELLVVIAILSILVSILLPALSRAKELARSTLCITNLKSIGVAWFLYLDDNQETFPLWSRNMHILYGGKHPAIINETQPGIALDYRPINPYVELELKNETGLEVFRCPSERAITHPEGLAGGTYGYGMYEYFGNCYAGNIRLFSRYNLDVGKPIQKPFNTGMIEVNYFELLLAGDMQWFYTIAESPWDANFHGEENVANVLFMDGHISRLTIEPGVWRNGFYTIWPYDIYPERKEAQTP